MRGCRFACNRVLRVSVLTMLGMMRSRIFMHNFPVVFLHRLCQNRTAFQQGRRRKKAAEARSRKASGPFTPSLSMHRRGFPVIAALHKNCSSQANDGRRGPSGSAGERPLAIRASNLSAKVVRVAGTSAKRPGAPVVHKFGNAAHRPHNAPTGRSPSLLKTQWNCRPPAWAGRTGRRGRTTPSVAGVLARRPQCTRTFGRRGASDCRSPRRRVPGHRGTRCTQPGRSSGHVTMSSSQRLERVCCSAQSNRRHSSF